MTSSSSKDSNILSNDLSPVHFALKPFRAFLIACKLVKDDLAICFYGGEPLLKTRVIYKVMDMIPNAKFIFQALDVTFFSFP